MKTRPTDLKQKNGAALVIVLGFLAILTITIIAFTTQTRSERISGRAYVSSAQTAHLLNTALTDAMSQIDQKAGSTFFPPFIALSSSDSEADQLLCDSIQFDTEADFFPQKNQLLSEAFNKATNDAEWLPILNHDQSAAIGRIGYIVVNTTGLLDANTVGGVDENGDYRERRAGTSPAEIQLSNHKRMIDEFHANSTLPFPHISPDTPAGVLRTAADPELSAAQAFVHNRDQAWKRFETIRDIKQLGMIHEPNIFTTDIESFSTWSFDPREDRRVFMGTNSATLNEVAIREEIPAVANADFVLNQLRDYLDTDTDPEDEYGNYTDLSVEPVPMINEIVLQLQSTFEPVIEFDTEGEPYVERVNLTNSMILSLEVWYPFIGYDNPDTFAVQVYNVDALSYPSYDLVGDINEWETITEIDGSITSPTGKKLPYVPFDFEIPSTNTSYIASSKADIDGLFAELDTEFYFEEVACINQTTGRKVDRVRNVIINLLEPVSNVLLPEIEDLSDILFDAEQAVETNIVYEVGLSARDPRLNWNGTDTAQWIEVDDLGHLEDGSFVSDNLGYFEFLPSLGDINFILNKDTNAANSELLMHVRNTDRIDTPFELTYLLYSDKHPWQTFQMLAENDPYNTRSIIKNLSPYENNPPRHGRINPYTIHQNVLTAAFMNMPLNEYNPHNLQRLGPTEAYEAALYFQNHIRQHGWPDHAAEYGDLMKTEELKNLTGITNPWAQESFIRNTYELFNPRDTLYTVIIAAQSGTDADQNGLIEDDEVQGTRQAVASVWRDPLTGKSAPVFFGLTDTLRKNEQNGQSVSDLLQAFRP